MEVFFTKVPLSKNNFRTRVPQEQGSHAHIAHPGFIGLNIVKSVGDPEEGRKPVIWDEAGAGSAADLEAGLNNVLPEGKDGSFSSYASPDLAGAMQLGGSGGSATLNPRRSSWGRKSGNWEISPDVMALAAGLGESNRTVRSSNGSVTSENH